MMFRDVRSCGPACTEPYASCTGEMHCAHDSCGVAGCMCSCHYRKGSVHPAGCQCFTCRKAPDVKDADVQETMPEYYLSIGRNDLWACCVRFLVRHLNARWNSGLTMPQDGEEAKCITCSGTLKFRNGRWK